MTPKCDGHLPPPTVDMAEIYAEAAEFASRTLVAPIIYRIDGLIEAN